MPSSGNHPSSAFDAGHMYSPPPPHLSAHAQDNAVTAAQPDGNPMSILEQFHRMPLLLTVVIVVYFLVAPITALQPTPFGENTGQFMIKQLALNSSLLIIFSTLYGLMVLAFPKGAVSKYQNMLLPIILTFSMWFKSYMTYRSGLIAHCTNVAKESSGMYSGNTQPYMQSTLLWNTSKVPIAILVTYVFVILFPRAFTPFFQFFSGDEEPHPLILYFAIGFWTGCAAWASEASCYFQLVRSGCRPFDNIQFETIATVEETDDE
jgi:hypothetical protein